ncbi:hypothetical protein SLS60_002182 [Paraconiothyrium brasiliense]|uniref:Uncharacterized protein n=1 Tax=Paraconiothyrium brasiliense TaxID=300254 RepID=A0ABR3S236_9PLEO
MADLVGTKNDDELTEYRMLRIYHTMAEILGATCLSPEQAVFDHHSSSFLSIVTQCHDVALSVEPSKHAHISSRLPGARRRAWPDISWIPPLYYTAIKCRDHQIRTRAVDLMSSFWPYEIVWDLGILNVSSIVAKEVIRMEEAEFITPAVKVQESEDNIMPKNILEHDLVPSRLSLPEERRFDTVEMVLLNDVPRSIQMVCRKWLQGRERVIRKIYNEAEDTWIKVEEEPTSRSNVRGSAAYSTKGTANRI